jgi:energy-converting hydrogenase Eha subunit E
MPQSGSSFMLGTGWAGGLSIVVSSVLVVAGGSSPVVRVAGLSVDWVGWSLISLARVGCA